MSRSKSAFVSLFFFSLFSIYIFATPCPAQTTTTVVTLDNPAPSGAPDSLLNGVFQGIDFGTGQWRWSGPYGADSTNNAYFASSSGTSRSFSFSPGPRLLSSINVYTTTTGTLTLSDGVNPPVTRAVTTGSMQLATTGWTQGSTVVTVAFSAGWSLGIDDITYRDVSSANPPILTITAPQEGATIAGTTINVTYTVSGDLTEADHAHFRLDGGPTVMDIDFDGVYQFTNVPVSSHVLSGIIARANHSEIAGSEDTLAFTTIVDPADPAPPTVSITAPVDGATASDIVSVTADASDNTAIAGVQFLLNGTALGPDDTGAPYSISWNTTTVGNGLYTLSARARDSAGNETVSTSVTVTVANAPATDPARIGQWSTPIAWPLVTVHTALLPTGEVLVFDGGTDQNRAGPSARLWNPTTGAFTAVPNNFTNIFCAGHSFLPDGTLLVAGGNADAFIGLRDTNLFDPLTRTWALAAPMTYPRWYPTTVTLADGRVLVVSGSTNCTTCIADIPEIYDPATNTWTSLPNARVPGPSPYPLYPFLFVLPDGRVLNPGSDEDPMATRVLDVQAQTWTTVDATVLEGGSAVMYRPGQIMKSGTASDVDRPTAPTIANTYVLDMNQPAPLWRPTAPMAFPRGHHNLTLLPDGTALVTGGGRTTDGVNTDLAVYEAELWSSVTEAWTTMASMQRPRLYHSTALLLPDGRVLSAGGGRFVGFPQIDQLNAEIYSPPYLFRGFRPAITSAPTTVQYATSFFVGTPNATNISRVTLLASGAVTHSVNMQQRFLELAFQQANGGLDVQLPANTNVAPPGDYMLFLIDANGVPSMASFVALATAVAGNPAPTTTTINPSSTTAGGPGFMLTVNGTNFVSTSVVRWNGADRTTTFVSATRLTATISASDIAVAGTAQVKVFNPAPGGGASNAQTFTITAVAGNPAPTTTTINPSSTTAGGPGFTLTVNGTNFVSTSVVRWNGADRTTPFVSATQLTATISASDIAVAGTAQVTVFNPAPGGGTSNAQTFTISNVSSGLIAAYSFNAGSGTVAADASGNGNGGTIAGATWTTAGRFGNALSFNGTSNMVTVNGANSLDFTTRMTLQAWVYPTVAPSGWRTVIAKEQSGNVLYYLDASSSSSNRPATGIFIGGAERQLFGGSRLTANTWTHLAATYDSATQRLYVNGAQVASRAQTGAIATSASPLGIGGNSVWGEFFRGRIDEVRVYNRALSQAEIQNDMNTAINP